MILDFFITWLFKEKLIWNKYFANGLGFISAASSNFMLNRFWTFHSNAPNIGFQYGGFLLAGVTGLGISTAAIFYLTQKHGLNFYFSKLLSIGIVVIWNFSISYFFLFKN